MTVTHLYDVSYNDVCVCGPQLSSQHVSVCRELKEVQEQLRQAGEEVRRKDRQQEEQQRESRRLQEEQDGLQRHKEQLQDELQELRYPTHLNTERQTQQGEGSHLTTSPVRLHTHTCSSSVSVNRPSPPHVSQLN